MKIDPAHLEMILPNPLRFYHLSVMDRLDLPMETGPIQTVLEGEPLFLQARVPLNPGGGIFLVLQLFGDAEPLSELSQAGAFLELTNILAGRLSSHAQAKDYHLEVGVPESLSTSNLVSNHLRPIGIYHLSHPTLQTSQGLLLVALELRDRNQTALLPAPRTPEASDFETSGSPI